MSGLLKIGIARIVRHIKRRLTRWRGFYMHNGRILMLIGTEYVLKIVF